MRINEPFVKVSYALWLVSKGANNIEVSVDGAEPEHEVVANALASKGYQRAPLESSNADYTGIFSNKGVVITVLSRPGIDIKAYFQDGKILVAECKGEPTSSGVKSGLDLTAFYTALGQLIITADDGEKLPSNLAVVMPDTPRLRERVIRFSKNARFAKLDVDLVLVDESGRISQI